MVLWTVIPPEQIFPAASDSSYEEVHYEGAFLLTERLARNQLRIIRILSTNPNDFLRQELQPGRLLNG